MFLAHFVGDIHQPLHAGFEADEGGNTILVHWYRRKSNLHHVSSFLIPRIPLFSGPFNYMTMQFMMLYLLWCKVWDVNIIETAMKDFYNDDLNLMIESIKNNITVSLLACSSYKDSKTFQLSMLLRMNMIIFLNHIIVNFS